MTQKFYEGNPLKCIDSSGYNFLKENNLFIVETVNNDGKNVTVEGCHIDFLSTRFERMFKVGDKVRIIKNESGSENEVGDIGTIVSIDYRFNSASVNVNHRKTYVNVHELDEIKLVETEERKVPEVDSVWYHEAMKSIKYKIQGYLEEKDMIVFMHDHHYLERDFEHRLFAIDLGEFLEDHCEVVFEPKLPKVGDVFINDQNRLFQIESVNGTVVKTNNNEFTVDLGLENYHDYFWSTWRQIQVVEN